MSYTTFGPANATTALAVCGGCAYRKRNQSKSFYEIDVLKSFGASGKTKSYGLLTTAIWQHDQLGEPHPCNREHYTDKINHPCAGALLCLYRLRGTNAWTEMMERRWQSGEYPKVMVFDEGEIGVSLTPDIKSTMSEVRRAPNPAASTPTYADHNTTIAPRNKVG